MFGFGRKKQEEHAGHSHMDHTGYAHAEMGSHPMSANDAGSKTLLKIEGMTCMHCKMSVEKALKSVEGVESVNVDLMRKEAVITGSAERDELIQAVEDAGYDVVA